MAKSLGVQSVVVHRYSGILSAYGLALADVVSEEQSPCHAIFARPATNTVGEPEERVLPNTLDDVLPKLVGIAQSAIDSMKSNGFEAESIDLELYLNLRYSGTDNAVSTTVQIWRKFSRQFYAASYKHCR
jgi:5-oxoprolinase (ATP-hydrolysing)